MNFSEPLPVASDNIDLKTNPEPEIRLELDVKGFLRDLRVLHKPYLCTNGFVQFDVSYVFWYK